MTFPYHQEHITNDFTGLTVPISFGVSLRLLFTFPVLGVVLRIWFRCAFTVHRHEWGGIEVDTKAPEALESRLFTMLVNNTQTMFVRTFLAVIGSRHRIEQRQIRATNPPSQGCLRLLTNKLDMRSAAQPDALHRSFLVRNAPQILA